MNILLQFRKFIEDAGSSIATDGTVADDPQRIGSTNADWTKSQAGGEKGVIRSKYVAQMKKKMTRK